MTMFMMTEALRDNLVYSLAVACGQRCNAEYNPCAERELLEMLKAMQPLEPVAYARFADNKNIRYWTHNPEDAPQVPDLMPLYTPEQSK
jgi:hypothetical protein